MKFNKKRGFTIVELIIVIAVIAILAAVLIPVFSNLIQQGKDADSKVLVNTLNKGVAMSGRNDYDTMHEVLAVVEQNVGVDVAKLNAAQAKGNTILWDSTNKTFVFLKSDGTYVSAPEVTLDKTDKYNLWKISDNTADLTDENGYSIYWTGENLVNQKVVNGFDAGSSEITSIVYKNDTTKAKNVVIRTNSEDTILSVEGYVNETDKTSGDTIKHYGISGEVDVVKCAMASFHEYGEIKGSVVITEGHFVLEDNSTVGTIEVSSNAVKDSVKLTNKSTESIVVKDAENKISADSSIGENSVKVTDQNAVALVGNKTYSSLYDAFKEVNDGDTVKLIADFRISGKEKSDRLEITKKITLDFGNYHIIGFGEMSSDNQNFSILYVSADTTFVGETGGLLSEHNETDNDCGPYGVDVTDGATLIVKSGVYHCGGTAIQVEEGHVEIWGGKISVEPYANAVYGYKYVINGIDENYQNSKATIVAYGGSFYMFDPANSKSEHPTVSFVADGYKVIWENDWYTVVKA